MEPRKLFDHWQLPFDHLREDLTPSGSPNRSVRRFTAALQNGDLYIAEGFDPRKKGHQLAINRTLEYLSGPGGLQWATPYRRTLSGDHGVYADGCFWQLRPWISADTLPRETLGNDQECARIWGKILLDLQRVSREKDFPAPGEVFRFKNYLPTLSAFTARKMPFFSESLRKIIAALGDFLADEESLPLSFAHGDFHPGNILIAGGKLQSVIDWEFCGWKCAGYDLALLLGCLGADNPEWLDGAAVDLLHRYLDSSGYLPPEVWRRMPEMMAVIRLGWLGEWLDLNDREMAARELEYINILLA